MNMPASEAETAGVLVRMRKRFEFWKGWSFRGC